MADTDTDTPTTKDDSRVPAGPATPTFDPSLNTIDPNLGAAFDKMITPGSYKKAVEGETAVYQKHLTDQERLAADRAASDARYAARQEQMLAREGATLEEVRPWNAKEEMTKYSHNLWEDFGSPGFLVGMLASSFTGMPMTSALNAGAAAINAINQGDNDSYNKAYDAWKDNTALTIKRMDMEIKAFDQIDKLRSSNFAEWQARATELAARFGDERKLAMLNAGYSEEAIQVQSEMAGLQQKLIKSSDDIRQNNIRRIIAMSMITENGKIKPEYVKHPEKIAEAWTAADELMAVPTTPEGHAVQLVLRQPGFYDQKAEDQQKQIDAAVAGVSNARYGHRGVLGDASARAETATEQWATEQETTTGNRPSYDQILDHYKEVLSGLVKAQQPNQTKRTDIQEKDAETRLKTLQEKIRHDEATEQEKKEKAAGGAALSGNRLDKIQSQIDQYDNNLKYIKEIKDAIKKYHYSVGFAGQVGRVGERLADVLAGSTETDRVQIMRDLEKLKLGASRLLLDAEGRPLSASEHRIDDIIGGGSYGDLTANTLRSLDELEKDYVQRRNQHNNRLPEPQRRQPTVTVEQPTVSDKPASWDDIPSVTPK